MNSKISILLAEDHSLVRELLRAVLQHELDFAVVATAANAAEGAEQCIRLQPDIVLMDIDMPDLSAFEAVRLIKTRCPATQVIFLTAFSHDRYIEEALRSGAAGYLLKSEPPETLIRAIRSVHAGSKCFSKEIEARLTSDQSGTRLAGQNLSRSSLLSSREIEVLRYLARGLPKKQVAQLMHLSVKTIERHSERLMGKLEIHDRVELARFAIREGLAEP